MSFKSTDRLSKVIKANSALEVDPICLDPIKSFPKSDPPSTDIQSEPDHIDTIQTQEDRNEAPETPLKQAESQSEIEHIPVKSSAEIEAELKQELMAKVNDEIAIYKQQQLDEIEEELATLKETTKKTAYEQGLIEGEAVFKANSDELMKSINALAKDKKEDIFGKREFVIKLASAMAERIVKKQIELDDDTFATLFMEAFDKITDKDHVVIEVNGEDEPLVQDYRKSFEEKFKDIDQLDIRINNDIIRGGCTIETNLGYIDASVSSKLDLLKKAIDAFHKREDDIHGSHKDTAQEALTEPVEEDVDQVSENILENIDNNDISDADEEDGLDDFSDDEEVDESEEEFGDEDFDDEEFDEEFDEDDTTVDSEDSEHDLFDEEEGFDADFEDSDDEENSDDEFDDDFDDDFDDEFDTDFDDDDDTEDI